MRPAWFHPPRVSLIFLEAFRSRVKFCKRWNQAPTSRAVGSSKFFGEVDHGTAEICEQSEIWKGGGQEREERDRPKEKRHAEVRTRRKRRNGQEPEAGDCDRSFRSPQERRESPSQEGSVAGNCPRERLSAHLTLPASNLVRHGWNGRGDDERQNPKSHVAQTAELSGISNSARPYCRSNRVLCVPLRNTLDSCSAEISSKSQPFAWAQWLPHQRIG